MENMVHLDVYNQLTSFCFGCQVVHKKRKKSCLTDSKVIMYGLFQKYLLRVKNYTVFQSILWIEVKNRLLGEPKPGI